MWVSSTRLTPVASPQECSPSRYSCSNSASFPLPNIKVPSTPHLMITRAVVGAGIWMGRWGGSKQVYTQTADVVRVVSSLAQRAFVARVLQSTPRRPNTFAQSPPYLPPGGLIPPFGGIPLRRTTTYTTHHTITQIVWVILSGFSSFVA